MADDKGKKPEGPLGQDYWDVACFPGRLLTFVITDCTNGAPILQFSAFDAKGAFHASNNGTNVMAFCTLPGYQFTVSAGGYSSLTVSVDRKMFDDRQVVICLMPIPQNLPSGTRPNGWCFVAAAAGLDPKSDDAFLEMARAFRSIMRTGRRGGEIIAAYEAEESEGFLRKLAEDREFMAQTLSVALRAMPLVARIVERARGDRVGMTGFTADERLDPALAKDIRAILKQAEDRTGGWKFLPLVAEAAKHAEHVGVMAAILAERPQD
jgi:hypothetical protein